MTVYFFSAEFIDSVTKISIYGLDGFIDVDRPIANSENGQEVLAKVKEYCIDKLTKNPDYAALPTTKAILKITAFSRVN